MKYYNRVNREDTVIFFTVLGDPGSWGAGSSVGWSSFSPDVPNEPPPGPLSPSSWCVGWTEWFPPHQAGTQIEKSLQVESRCKVGTQLAGTFLTDDNDDSQLHDELPDHAVPSLLLGSQYPCLMWGWLKSWENCCQCRPTFVNSKGGSVHAWTWNLILRHSKL